MRPARLIAGAKENDVGKIVDDDETTSWSNDGKRSTAWVRLEFDRPTMVNQFVMRLGSWRTRSYPLRVSSDDGKTVVFQGVAGRTVGYSTIEFKPITCRSLRIELTGERQESDGRDLVEVTGKSDAHGGADTGGKGTLAIHGLEVYSPRATPTALSR